MSILLAPWFSSAAATAAAAVAKPDDDEVVDEDAVSNFIKLVEKCQGTVLNDCTEQEATLLLEELQAQEDKLWNVLDELVSQQAAIVRTVLESYASSSSSSSLSSHPTMWTTDICDAWRDLVSSSTSGLYGSWWHLLWPPPPPQQHQQQQQQQQLDWNDMDDRTVSNIFDLVCVLRDAYPLAPPDGTNRRRWVAAATLPPPTNEAWKMVYVYVLCHVVATTSATTTTTTIPNTTIAAWMDVDDFASTVQGRVDKCLWHSRPARAAVALYLWDWWWQQQPLNASMDSTLIPANLTLERVLDQCMGSIRKYVKCRQFLFWCRVEYWCACIVKINSLSPDHFVCGLSTVCGNL
jgi:hypothetical protein